MRVPSATPLLTLVLTVAAAAALSAQAARLTGTVTYRERVALPPTAVVDVTLEDVTRIAVSTDVIARTQFTPAGEGPFDFLLYYDAARVDPARRYAVRARIVDGERVLFDSGPPMPVLTQGRGSQAALTLRFVSRPAGAVPATAPAGAPPNATTASSLLGLRTLPATFAGTLAGIRYQFDLFDDDAYFLRTTATGQAAADRLGSYVLSSDRRALVLDGGEVYLIRSNTVLRRVDAAGRTVGDLRRTGTVSSAPRPVTAEGVYRQTDGVATFTECATGQEWLVTAGPAASALAAAADESGPLAAAAVLASVEGMLRSRTSAGALASSLEVGRVVDVTPRGRCAPRFAAAPLQNTRWHLTTMGEAVAGAAGERSDVTVTFRDDQARSFGVSTGCNKLSGGYEVAGDSLTVHSVGALRVCEADPGETTFRTALDEARSYRILGRTLEFFDAERRTLARFEATR